MATYTTHQSVTSDAVFSAEDIFQNVYFEGSGAAISIDAAVMVTVNGSTFSSGTATARAGGVNVQPNGAVLNVGTGTLFENNVAVGDAAGALFIGQGEAFVDGATFTGNTMAKAQPWGGGAIYNDASRSWHSSNYVSLTVKNSTFTNNMTTNGGRGGAADLWGWNVFENNLFEGNVVTAESGGAIDVYQKVVDTGSTYTRNRASGHGGAILLLSQGGSVVEGNFTSIVVDSNTAGTGGGISQYNASTLVLTDSTVSNNIGTTYAGGIYSASNATITNTLITGNVAGARGSGIYTVAGAMNIEDSVISYNTGAQYGGGMFVGEGFTDGPIVTLTNTDVIGNWAHDCGGGITIWYGTATINGGTFADNRASVEYVTFERGGGGMNIRRGVGIVNGGLWKNNTAYTGGAINLWDWGTAAITGVTFEGNTADVGGGAFNSQDKGADPFEVTIADSSFTHNFTPGQGGGAVRIAAGTATITSSIFDSNTAATGDNSDAGYGGAILVIGPTLAIVDDSVFTNNYADGYWGGGAIHVGNDSSLSVSNSDFTDNRELQFGGAIGTVWGSMTVTDSSFTGNTVGMLGGALSKYAAGSDASTASVSGATFSNNYAEQYGGAIYGKNFIIDNSVFDSNTAGWHGGAFHLNRHDNWGWSTVSNSLFTHNVAVTGDGGAISIEGSASGETPNLLTVTGSTFTENLASLGGAIFVSQWSGSSYATATVVNSLFEGNTVTGQYYGGGAIYNNSYGDVLDVTGSTFANNVAIFDGGQIDGGAITNLRGLVKVNNSLFVGNAAGATYGMGGAIVEYGMGKLEVSNSTFKNNSAFYGAGIGIRSINDPDTVTLTNVTFEGNTATLGGALFAANAANNLTIDGMTCKTRTDTVYICAKNLVTLKGDIEVHGTFAMECGATVDGLNLKLYSPDSHYFGGDLVKAEGAATGFESLTLAGTGNAYFESVDLTDVNVTVVTEAFSNVGTYTVVRGITAMDTDINISRNFVVDSVALDTPYLLTDPSLAQKTYLEDIFLMVKTADTFYVGVDASEANGFDMFETQYDLEAVYGQDFQGTVISYTPQNKVFLNNAWTANSYPEYVYADGVETNLYWGSNAFSDVDNAKRMLADGGSFYIVDNGVPVNYLGNRTFYANGVRTVCVNVDSDTFSLDLRAAEVDQTVDTYNVTLENIESENSVNVFAGACTVTGDAVITVRSCNLMGGISALGDTAVAGTKALVVEDLYNSIEGITGFDSVTITDGSQLTLWVDGLFSEIPIINNGALEANLMNDKWTYKDLVALKGVDSFDGLTLNINATPVDETTYLNDGYQRVAVKDGSMVIEALASRVGGNYTMDSLVTQSRTNYIKFNAGVDGTMSAQTLDRDLKFEGNGVDATSVTAGALYAAGNSLMLKDLTWTGSVYGGVKDDEIASVELVLDNVALTKDIYGAGVAANDNLSVTDTVEVTLTDVTGNKSYYGAGYANGGDITVNDVNTFIDGGTYKSINSGANLSANATGKSYTLGTAELTIEDGVFNGIVGNGGFVRAGQTSTQGHSVLNISGGTFNAAVYGGAFAYGTGSKTTAISAGTATVTDGIDVTITGGVFNGDIYGGSLASNSHIASANTSVSGEIYVTLDASQNDIYINGNVIAGSLGKGAINGNTIVYVFGDGDKLHFSSDSWVTGTSEYGNSVNGYVSGIKVLAFNEFTGSFTANVGNGAFDRVTVALDSDVAITNAEFDQVSQWSLYIDSCISGNLSANALDLSGDTINVNTIEAPLGDAEVTLLNSATGLTWDSNTAVNILGETAAATATDGVWESDNYRLTATAAGTLTVGKLLV